MESPGASALLSEINVFLAFLNSLLVEYCYYYKRYTYKEKIEEDLIFNDVHPNDS